MSDDEYARQLQEKFELYLLALVFTLLGLAVQTAKFESNDWANFLELTGWVSLIVSGVVGISRLEWLPVAHFENHKKKELRAQLIVVQEHIQAGRLDVTVSETDEIIPIEVALKKIETSAEKTNRRIDNLQKSTLTKYTIHKWTFISGLVLMACARGWAPAEGLIRKLIFS